MPEDDARRGRFGSPPLTLLLGTSPDAARIPALSAELRTVAPPLPPGFAAPDLVALQLAVYRMTVAFIAADFGPVLRAAQGLAHTISDAGEMLLSSPAARRVAYSGGLIVADPDGRFRVGGADDDIEWLREFWAFRHGDACVGPVFGARLRRFTVRLGEVERAARLREMWALAERHFDFNAPDFAGLMLRVCGVFPGDPAGEAS